MCSTCENVVRRESFHLRIVNISKTGWTRDQDTHCDVIVAMDTAVDVSGCHGDVRERTWHLVVIISMMLRLIEDANLSNL